MFDGIKFTGVVNLGNLSAAIINLIGVIALYFRIKAKMKEYQMRDKKPGGKRKDDPPTTPNQSATDLPVNNSTKSTKD